MFVGRRQSLSHGAEASLAYWLFQWRASIEEMFPSLLEIFTEQILNKDLAIVENAEG